MITLDKKSLLKAELIGLEAEVIDSNNKDNIGIKGKVTDETKNTLTIGGRVVLKKNAIIEFDADGKKMTIEGKKLAKNPEERIKNR